MKATALLAAIAMLAAGQASGAETLRVFAASSLTESFREIAALFEKAHPGLQVEINLAGSQVLRLQIEQGAPADVFASADLAQADALRDAGLLPRYDVFARNTLVLVVPVRQPKVKRLEDVAQRGVKLVVAGRSVPAGLYTLQMLARAAGSGQFGDDFRSRVQANIVSEETNVRLVLAKVALGEADAGFVYRTDAAASPEVMSLPIPEAYNATAEYPIGVVAKAASPAKARAFVDLVLSADGQAILEKRGFTLTP